MADYCEKQLAMAFAPELAYDGHDDTRHEPYWAARLVDGSRVRIAYLYSYYRDLGAPQPFACQTPFIASLCASHNGDSEVVALEVYYQPEYKRWLVHHAWYSVHGNYHEFSRSFAAEYAGVGSMQYPGRPGGHPRVWVAKYKHANYPNKSSCDGGGQLGFDTCDNNNLRARLAVNGNRNIGSRTYPFIDCVPATNTMYEHYGTGKNECFWSQATTTGFRGWVPDQFGGGQANHYSGILSGLGF